MKLGKILSVVIVIGLLSALLGTVVSANVPAAPAQAPSVPYTFKPVVTGTSGGYVPEIIFSTVQQNLIYARTDMGGAYRWNESTQSWTQLMNWVTTDMWNDTGVDALAADPSDPNKMYMLVGTYTNEWAPTNGAVMISNDKGNTFTRVGLPFKVGGNMLGRAMGPRLVIDPNLTTNLWLGARSGNGLYRSTNSGTTWTKVTNFPDVGQYAQLPGDAYQGDIMGIAWIAIDKASGSSGSATPRIYVGVGDPTGTNIYYTTNNGSSWAAVPGQLTCSKNGSTVTCNNGVSWTNGTTCPNHTGDGFIPHHGVISSDGYLYVPYSNTLGPYDGDIGEVYKMQISSGTWTRISPAPPGANGDCSNAPMDWLTGYGGIAIDAQNPQRLLVTELNRWWPDVNFWRSTDGGTTWTSAWTEAWPPNFYAHYNGPDISTVPWLNFGQTSPPMGDPPTGVKLGWMVGSVSIDPFNSNRFFYGTGATVYGATDLLNWDTGGKTNIKTMGKGMEQTSVLGMISPPSGTTRLFTVMGDVAGFKHASLDAVPSTMYTIPYAGTYNAIDYAEANPAFMVRVGTGNPSASTPYRGTAFTYDSGGSWFQGNADPVPGTGAGTVAAAANGSRVLWAPNGSNTYFSTDNGNSWTQSQGIPSGAVIASDRVNAAKFYGIANGSFYVSTNSGANFSAVASGLPTFGEVHAVPGIEGDVWVVGGDPNNLPMGMWHITNSGSTVVKLANVTEAATIGFGLHAPGQTYPAIYAAARVDGLLTIHRSDDGGAGWVRITDDQHMYASIQTITGDPTIYGRVYFGTNGLGAVYGDCNPCTGGPTPTPTRTSAVTNTPTRTNTPVTPGASNTPTRTLGPTNTGTPPPTTLVPSNTPTRTATRTATGPTPTRTRTRTPTRTPTGPTPTNTIGIPTNTPTRTSAVTNTPTRTNTPVTPGASNTPTRTSTTGPTATPTPTSGGVCSPATSDITAPYIFEAAGVFCWRSTNLGAYVNSWNTNSVTLNGVNITNIYVPASSYPPQIGGYWYVGFDGSFAWSHFEAK